jgi:hypothetical protein
MKKAALAIAAVVVSAAVSPHAEGQGSGLAGLEALSAALRGNPAWQADYNQEYIAAGMGAGDEVSGAVFVAWPDRALFRSTDPTTQIMGLEGRLVRLVDLEVPSCDEHLLDDEEWARVPLAAVLDPHGAVDRFTVLDHGERGFILVPREPGGVDHVEVVLGEDNLPGVVVVVDPQGATNRLRFTGWHPVDGPPNGSWLPEAPPGLECIGDDGGDF